eukprot:scaffold21904_cov112-Phaeocystis_antarctica.AAC.1
MARAKFSLSPPSKRADTSKCGATPADDGLLSVAARCDSRAARCCRRARYTRCIATTPRCSAARAR